MTLSILSLLAVVAAGASALSIPANATNTTSLTPGCHNGPNSRQCWGQYDINTDYYTNVWHTGNTVEYWLSLEEVDCAPDGYTRKCQTANGTVPGPAITANWGDDVIIHVTNNIPNNGSSIHWHGIRQLHTGEFDGVPGVTQCPIAPGDTFTYKFHASQYGSSVYHSHFSLQYSMGLYGPLIINGPATANYDEDLGTVILSDWDHATAYEIWNTTANLNVTFNGYQNGLVNGMNTGNCNTAGNSTEPDRCTKGKKFELVFEEGKRYRIRVINLGTESWFQFSIDGHSLTVISTDFVPIVPYEADSVLVNIGQRYDVIVEANAKPDNYWLRSGFLAACMPNGNAENITGIVRYNNASTADPTSESTVVVSTNYCVDEPNDKLVPWLPKDVTNTGAGIKDATWTGEFVGPYIRWALNNGSFMWVNWSAPAIGNIISGNTGNIPVQSNIIRVDTNATIGQTIATQYAVLVLQDETPITGISHPIHLHGHDFNILATSFDLWNGTTTGWQLKNPPRRDTATLPPNGHLVLAFALDNPGLWAIHCHIAWHSSQGYGATILESMAHIQTSGSTAEFGEAYIPTCKNWNKYQATMPWHQDDSGV